MRRFDVILVGGGHANIAVLADWVRKGTPGGGHAALLTPQPFLTYSGMVPGWLAGRYQREDGRVDLAALCQRAGVEWIAGHCVGLDPERQIVVSDRGEQIAFAWASIDTGAVGRARETLGDDPRLCEVRPMDRFVAQFDAWRSANRQGAQRIAVIGGGAGGVELAFACANMASLDAPCEVVLVTGRGGLLPGFGGRLKALATRELAGRGIAVIADDARVLDGALYTGAQCLEPVDIIIAALGSAAPDWPQAGGLACDAAGFIAVDRYQRSLSHPHIFAAGDIATRTDRAVPHSGVHAVHTGPVLAANLRAVLTGKQLRSSYTPRPASLYLISCGDGTALASYGACAAQGRWAQALKQRIDSRWIAAYAKLAGA
ncbi:MAG: NADH dehydrogenase [Erythrobacter sp. SCN 62-14]|nr:MAG: NADH dehydrogenase [Erythrobacter sp. SCN 62-14]